MGFLQLLPVNFVEEEGMKLLYLILCIAGIMSHLLVFKHGEWHLHGTLFISFSVCLHGLSVLYLCQKLDQNVWWSMRRTAAFGASYYTGIFSSISIYRLVFHRLSHLPGPRLAAFSKLWHAYYTIDGKGHLLLDDLHHKYGDVVRTGPTEVAVFHPDALYVLNETHKNETSKPAWYDLIGDLGGLNLHRDKRKHAFRRRLWLQALSSRNLVNYRPALAICKDQFRDLIEANLQKPVDFSDFCAWFSWDYMGMFSFSSSFDMMKNGDWVGSIKLLRDAMYLLAPSTPIPWAFQLAMDIPVIEEARIFHRMLKMGKANMDNRITIEKALPDISEHLIRWSREHGTMEEDLEALQGDGITMMIAGSDTTTITLIYAFYYLVKDAEHMRKLRFEVDQLDEPMNPEKLASLPYLNGLLKEVMRLHPAIPTAGIRETGPNGLTIGDIFIPGDTVVYAPRYSLGRLESCWERPNECIPERWSTQPELIKNAKSYAPFSGGMYSCVGKSLALESLREVIATIAREFDFKFASPAEAGKVVEAYRDNLTAITKNLNVIINRRDEKGI